MRWARMTKATSGLLFLALTLALSAGLLVYGALLGLCELLGGECSPGERRAMNGSFIGAVVVLVAGVTLAVRHARRPKRGRLLAGGLVLFGVAVLVWTTADLVDGRAVCRKVLGPEGNCLLDFQTNDRGPRFVVGIVALMTGASVAIARRVLPGKPERRS